MGNAPGGWLETDTIRRQLMSSTRGVDNPQVEIDTTDILRGLLHPK